MILTAPAEMSIGMLRFIESGAATGSACGFDLPGWNRDASTWGFNEDRGMWWAHLTSDEPRLLEPSELGWLDDVLEDEFGELGELFRHVFDEFTVEEAVSVQDAGRPDPAGFASFVLRLAERTLMTVDEVVAGMAAGIAQDYAVPPLAISA